MKAADTFVLASKGCVLAAIALTLPACTEGWSPLNGVDSADDGPTRSENALTALLTAGYAGSWPTGLDPATSTTGRANISQMNAIFGGLFQVTADDGGNDAKVIGVLAKGYEILDGGRSLVIQLREGTVFSDGTPFDAAAVRFSIERAIGSSCTCAPSGWPWDASSPVTTPDESTVVLHFKEPYAAAINFIPASNLNWIVSPSALEALGEDQFRLTPVGAGPFRVVSNQLSSRLVLERNPLYWEEGRPYLDRLVFQTIGGEQAGLHALMAGDAQVLEGVTSTPLIEQAKRHDELIVTQQPATAPYTIQLNTRTHPFDDRRAREAIYYATDVDAIRIGLFHGWYPASQSFTAPGGLFHVESVPGYRTHDPARAKQLVEQLGGLNVTLASIRSFVAEQVLVALQSQWQAAGIDVTIELLDLAPMIQEFQAGSWQAVLQAVGSFDPEAGVGISLRFSSGGTYSGVHDLELDELLRDALRVPDFHARERLYFAAAKHISDNAYAPFLFAFAPAQVVAAGVEGPGLTTRIPPLAVNTAVLWQDVRIAAGER